jgi:hypothetical protein
MRTDTGWIANNGAMKVKVKPESVQPVLTSLVSLEAKRLVTEDTAKYAELEVTEELAGRLTAYRNDKPVADLLLGGFQFDQMAQKALGYVRKPGKKQVFEIEGFAAIQLKVRFDQFRDKKLLSLEPEDLLSVDWTDFARNRNVILKTDGGWHYSGMEAVDTVAFDTYLSNLVKLQGSVFGTPQPTDDELPWTEKLTLFGNQMDIPTVITAYLQSDDKAPFLIHSTANPEAYFVSDSTGLYKRIFGDLRKFWPDGQ